MRFTHNGKGYKTLINDTGLGIEYSIYTDKGDLITSTVIGYDFLGSTQEALKDTLDTVTGYGETNKRNMEQIRQSFKTLPTEQKTRLHDLDNYVMEMYELHALGLTDFETEHGIIPLHYIDSDKDIVNATTGNGLKVNSNGWDVYSFVAYSLLENRPLTLMEYERLVIKATRPLLVEAVTDGLIAVEIVETGDELILRYAVDNKTKDIELINTVHNLNELVDLVQESLIRG